MSVVVTFRVEAFIAVHSPDVPERMGQFDQALGEAVITIAHTPQVWRQAAFPASVEDTPEGLALTYASQWRTVFENVKKASDWVTILTGSPAVAIVAETLLDRVLPPNTRRRVAIGDVLVDGAPAEEWFEQLEEADRRKARKAIEDAVEHARVPLGPPPWYLRLFNHPILFAALLLVVATMWTAWDALVRRGVDPDPSPQIEVAVTLPATTQSTDESEAVRVEVSAPSPPSRCIPVRIQRGETIETVCARTN